MDGYSRKTKYLLTPPKRPQKIIPNQRNVPPPDIPPPDLESNTERVEQKSTVTKEIFTQSKSQPSNQIRNKSMSHLPVNNSRENNPSNVSTKKISGTRRSFIRKPPSHQPASEESVTPSVADEDKLISSQKESIASATLPHTFTHSIQQTSNGNRRSSLRAWGSSRELVERVVNSHSSSLSDLRPGLLTVKCINISFDSKSARDKACSATLNFCIKDENRQIHFPKELADSGTLEQSLNTSLTFNIHNPADFIVNDGHDILMSLQMRKKTLIDDILLGEVVFSIVRFLSSKEVWEESIIIKDVNEEPCAQLQIQIQYDRVNYGLFVLSLHELNCTMELRYQISLKIGDKSSQSKNGVTDLNNSATRLNGDELSVFIDNSNWFADAKILLTAENKDKQRDIGTAEFKVSPYLKQKSEQTKLSLTINQTPNEVNEEIRLKAGIQFYIAGHLEIKIFSGKNLRGDTRMPYLLKFYNKDLASKFSNTTKAARRENGNTVWNESIVMRPVDNHLMSVECYQTVRSLADEVTSVDELIGFCDISLIPVYKFGRIDTWLDLKFTNEFGTTIDAGHVNVSMIFKGPDGIAYPQRQPEMASFDEKSRIYSKGMARTDKLTEESKLKPASPSSPNTKLSSSTSSIDMEFSDEEIKDAFNFLDLDKNGYIGISELRHILFCMGFKTVSDKVLDMVSHLENFLHAYCMELTSIF